MTKIVVLNGAAVNFDGKIDWNSLGDDVTVYDQTPQALIATRTADADIVVTKEMPMPEAVIAQLPASVQLCIEAGTGYNNYTLAALRKRQIALCNIPAYSTQRVAQTAVMLMLNLASSMQTQLAMLAKNDFSNFTEHLQVPHVELNGKVLGVFGYGHIGQALIAIAQAMGMRVLVSTRTKRADLPGVHFTTADDLLANSDVVSLNLPLTPQTAHMINQAALAKMKPSAFLINTARGGLVDEQALVAALRKHEIAGAGLDVQEHEPLAADSPLFALDNVIVTPHMGWKGLETRQRLVKIIRENIDAWLAQKPINRVDNL
ncbi:NAD(P)-dependent oxidoreductase [Lacticaseibacillus jixiensis]|uniref:NAD(P)-dependent oxidoreductase n=1 Tax=Lacticaseibacillus jixiensis TaxID=3231926 RepID=UPI0036F27CD7